MVLCATSTPGPVLSTLPLEPLELLLAHPESASTPTIMIPKHAKSFFLVSMCCTSSSKIQNNDDCACKMRYISESCSVLPVAPRAKGYALSPIVSVELPLPGWDPVLAGRSVIYTGSPP